LRLDAAPCPPLMGHRDSLAFSGSHPVVTGVPLEIPSFLLAYDALTLCAGAAQGRWVPFHFAYDALTPCAGAAQGRWVPFHFCLRRPDLLCVQVPPRVAGFLSFSICS
jgi:hypothetical protein